MYLNEKFLQCQFLTPTTTPQPRPNPQLLFNIRQNASTNIKHGNSMFYCMTMEWVSVKEFPLSLWILLPSLRMTTLGTSLLNKREVP